MEQLYPNNCELSARAAFYDSLSSLQAELLSNNGADATLVDALQLMPQHGFAWSWDGRTMILAHCKGHGEGGEGQILNELPLYLSSLLGVPKLLGLIIEPNEDPKPTTSPASAVTSPAQPTTPPATEAAPAPEPEAATEADPSHSTESLTKEDWEIADGLIKALPVAVRKKFVAAFRAAFDIPQGQQVSAAITEMRHLVFIQRFVSEAEGVAMP